MLKINLFHMMRIQPNDLMVSKENQTIWRELQMNELNKLAVNGGKLFFPKKFCS